MHQYTFVAVSIAAIVGLLSCSSASSAAVLNCAPANLEKEVNPNIRSICNALYQALNDQLPQDQDYERGVNNLMQKRAKEDRNSINHVLLRFGRHMNYD